MPATPMPSRALAAMAAWCVAVPAMAVELAPGGSVLVRDNFNVIFTPGIDVGADPSLAGTVVADATRSFSMVVTTEFRSGMPPQTTTLTGQLHDWVVRRADTGTLDFYMSMTPFLSRFGGTITRPWQLGSTGAMGAEWRDDGAPGANPPTRLALSTVGSSASALYFTIDEGAPNWIEYPTPSAPVLFRSDLSNFSSGTGSAMYSYSTELFSSSGGSTPLTFYMPAIPEPSPGPLLLVGLAGLAAVRWRQHKALRRRAFGRTARPRSP
jgi:hypothetical protein